jgi:protein ImuB
MEKLGIGLWSGVVMGVSSKVPRRILALWFPRLPTDRLQRRANIQDAPPLVLVAKVDNAVRLSAVDRKATSLGLTIGQPLANARAMLPNLKVVATNDPADLKLLTRIADWCDRFTPFVALDGPRRLLLDVTGVTHLFGGEQAMLIHIRNSLEAKGFALRCALAGTAVAARALARYRDGAIVACGQEEQAMRPLPVQALNLDGLTLHALRSAGLKTVQQVASRKRSELMVRLGPPTLIVLDEALGKTAKPISPRRPPPDYWQEKNFAEPIATEDVIHNTLNALAIAVAKILERHGKGARQLEATFFRADGAVRRIVIEMGAATRDPAIIDRLFREKLSALSDPLDPGFGFDLIRLSAACVERIYLDALDLNALTDERTEINFLIDRLATRFGDDRILIYQPRDTNIPEEAWIKVPAQHAQPSKLLWKKTRKVRDAPRRPLRLFTTAKPIDFRTKYFVWRKAHRFMGQCEGPERIAMEWWRHETPQLGRDYFRVEDNEGRRYWIYRQGTQPQWFLHGVFA